MAEIPGNAEISFSNLSDFHGVAMNGAKSAVILSLLDREVFSDGHLNLPFTQIEIGHVFLTENDLAISTTGATYLVRGFWSAFERDALASIKFADGSELVPIDFIETFAGPDLLEQFFYSIETAANSLVGEEALFSAANGILDMCDLTQADTDIIECAATKTDVHHLAPRNAAANQVALPLETDRSLNRLFTEHEADFGS